MESDRKMRVICSIASIVICIFIVAIIFFTIHS